MELVKETYTPKFKVGNVFRFKNQQIEKHYKITSINNGNYNYKMYYCQTGVYYEDNHQLTIIPENEAMMELVNDFENRETWKIGDLVIIDKSLSFEEFAINAPNILYDLGKHIDKTFKLTEYRTNGEYIIRREINKEVASFFIKDKLLKKVADAKKDCCNGAYNFCPNCGVKLK